MKLLKAHEMASLDSATIKELGIPSLVLMENAARGLYWVIKERFPLIKRVLVVAGKGNNGGDGIALARMLHLEGTGVDIFLPMGGSEGDSKIQLDVAIKLGVKVLNREPSYGCYELIVDALLGTGFRPPVRGNLGNVIEKINASGVKVVSVDVPSGLSADTGDVQEPFVRADITVTFQFPKLCHILFPASKYCGEVFVQDISIPQSLAKDIRRELLLKEDIAVPVREQDTYKNKEGHVLLVGGSVGKTGALILSAIASTRAGSGLVSVGIPEELNPIIETSLVEEMSLPLPGSVRLSFFCADRILELQDRFSALGIGMGMDRYEEGQDIVLELIERWEKPLLLDADALNNLADSGKLDILKERTGTLVLTPHVGEFSRLCGVDSRKIIANQIDLAQEFSTKYGCYLVLKGARTVISTPEGKAYVSVRGSPAMAKGGSGDVLAGILTALIGKRMEVEEALKLGVFLHGLAGELAKEKLHTQSVRARDIVEEIPRAYRLLEERDKPANRAYPVRILPVSHT